MSFSSRLMSQLANDIKRQPKKAAVLAALLALGCAVWLPMLFRNEAAAAQPIAARPAAPAKTAKPDAKVKAPSRWTWKTISQANALAEMRPADESELEQLSETKLFSFVRELPPAVPEKTPTPAVIAEKPEKPKVDLTVTAIIIGSDRRFARINGVLAEVGDAISQGAERFRVAEIQPNAVVLSRDGETVVVSMSKPARTAKAPSIRIEPAQ